MDFLKEVINYSFYIGAAGLLFYYMFFFNRLARYKPKKVVLKEAKPVSVIICAKNELENLQENLTGILQQKYPVFEVVVVNDHSTDGTLEYLYALQNEHKHLTVLDFIEEKKSPGKKQVLEFGIQHAKYEHLLLTDADCKPVSSFWVTAMVSKFPEKDIILGVGRYTKGSGIAGWLTQMDTAYVAVQYLSFALAGKPYMSVGRNVAYKKSLFKQVGGFEKHYNVASGDDDLFINEASDSGNTGIMIDTASHTESASKATFNEWVKQKKRHLSAGFHYKLSNLALLGSYQFCVFLFYHAFVLSVCFSEELTVVSTIFVLKNFVQLSIHKRIFAKLDFRGILISSTIFDILSLYLNTLIGITNLITRKKGTW